MSYGNGIISFQKAMSILPVQQAQTFLDDDPTAWMTVVNEQLSC